MFVKCGVLRKVAIMLDVNFTFVSGTLTSDPKEMILNDGTKAVILNFAYLKIWTNSAGERLQSQSVFLKAIARDPYVVRQVIRDMRRGDEILIVGELANGQPIIDKQGKRVETVQILACKVRLVTDIKSSDTAQQGAAAVAEAILGERNK